MWYLSPREMPGATGRGLACFLRTGAGSCGAPSRPNTTSPRETRGREVLPRLTPLYAPFPVAEAGSDGTVAVAVTNHSRFPLPACTLRVAVAVSPPGPAAARAWPLTRRAHV